LGHGVPYVNEHWRSGVYHVQWWHLKNVSNIKHAQNDGIGDVKDRAYEAMCIYKPLSTPNIERVIATSTMVLGFSGAQHFVRL